PKEFAVIGIARRPLSDVDFRRKIGQDLKELRTEPLDPALWAWLEPRLHYLAGDLNDPATYRALRDPLAACDRSPGTGCNYLFYLSTTPELFAQAARRLGEAGLTREEGGHWRRLIIEKPFGRDLTSARALNQELRQVMAESQVYRIDHYLG